MKDLILGTVLFVSVIASMLFAFHVLPEYTNPSDAQVDTSLFVP